MTVAYKVQPEVCFLQLMGLESLFLLWWETVYRQSLQNVYKKHVKTLQFRYQECILLGWIIL